MKNAILLNLVFILSIAGLAPAVTRLVPDEYATIQAAIDACNDSDVVIVAPGTYTGEGNRDIDFRGKAITLRSMDPNDPNVVAATIIDCDGTQDEPHRGFTFNSQETAASSLAGLTITNGYAPQVLVNPATGYARPAGGAIYCWESSPTLINCSIRKCGAELGGGIYNYSKSRPQVHNCLFTENTAIYGGAGMYNRDDSNALVINCTFTANSSENRGAGMKNQKSSPTLINCTFERNLGGGISNIYSAATITDCTFIGNVGGGVCGDYSHSNISDCFFMDNSSDYGAGIEGSAHITNCTIMNNSASMRGGGICSGGTIANCLIIGNTAREGGGVAGGGLIMNCQVIDNVATVQGGGADVAVGRSRITGESGPETIIRNCTFAGNSAPEGKAIAVQPYTQEGIQVISCILWDGGNEIWAQDLQTITVSYSDVEGGWPGPGNIDADPAFVDSNHGNYHLLPASPCLNMGDPCFVPLPGEVDMDGQPRLINHRVDAGADEANYLGPTIGVWPRPLIVYTVKKRANAEIRVFSITNTGSGTLDCTVEADCDWIRIEEDSRPVHKRTTAITLVADVSNLSVGHHRCELKVSDPFAVNSPQMVPVHVYVRAVLNVPDEFQTIQDAIDNALEGSLILVADGIYAGEGNRNIDFKGKAITVRSENGPESCIIDCLDPNDPYYLWRENRGFIFRSGEGNESVVDGFTITNGSSPGCGHIPGGGAILCQSSSPTIANCIIQGNIASDGCVAGDSHGGGISLEESSPNIVSCIITNNVAIEVGGGLICLDGNPTISHCVIAGNKARHGAGMTFIGSSPIVTNCTFSGNESDAICCFSNSNMMVTNSILWDNSGSQIYSGRYTSEMTISYTDIQGLTEGIYVDPNSSLNWGPGNISPDPCFVCTGHWNNNDTPTRWDDFWVDGDYHLKSQAGRWDLTSESWVKDDVTSPCIDAGDMASHIGFEPFPNGGIINMGAYGGTAEASKSYFGLPVCETVIAGDINGDCRIDYLDLGIMAFHWLEEH